jgi:hypothetical protein
MIMLNKKQKTTLKHKYLTRFSSLCYTYAVGSSQTSVGKIHVRDGCDKQLRTKSGRCRVYYSYKCFEQCPLSQRLLTSLESNNLEPTTGSPSSIKPNLTTCTTKKKPC